MRSSDGRSRGLAASCAAPPPSAIQVPRISLRTSWILMAPVLWGRCASADSAAIRRLSRYSSSCSKQMYRTLACPPEATLRAIWRAIVVLPVPWAPPMSSSSPARRPAPIVLSSGVKPRGTGWYSPTLPVVTFSLRSTSTSIAERGAMLPFGPSRRHAAFAASPVSVVTCLRSSSDGRELHPSTGFLARSHPTRCPWMGRRYGVSAAAVRLRRGLRTPRRARPTSAR